MARIDPTLEQQVRTLCDTQSWSQAAQLAIEGYGQELLAFLAATARDENAAAEVFQHTCIKIWNGLPRFTWRSSLRTWTYTIARNALRDHKRRKNPTEPLDSVELNRIPAELSRTATQQWRKTAIKQWLQDAIAELAEEDRSLMMLRLGREMRWTEIAEILADPDQPPPSDADLRRRAATLRKRYERLKETLRGQLPQDEGE